MINKVNIFICSFLILFNLLTPDFFVHAEEHLIKDNTDVVKGNQEKIKKEAKGKSKVSLDVVITGTVDLSDPRIGEVLEMYKQDGWIVSGNTISITISGAKRALTIDGEQYVTDNFGSVDVPLESEEELVYIEDSKGEKQKVKLKLGKETKINKIVDFNEFLTGEMHSNDTALSDDSNGEVADHNFYYFPQLSTGYIVSSTSPVHCNRFNGYTGNYSYQIYKTKKIPRLGVSKL